MVDSILIDHVRFFSSRLYQMALTLFKLAGAVSTAGLVADVGYLQWGPAAEVGSTAVRDLFDHVAEPWSEVLRISALVLAGVGAAATLLEVLCPRTLTRLVGVRRPAGSLVAATTSAI